MLHIRPSRRLAQCPTGGTRLSRPPVSGTQMLHIRPSRRLTQCQAGGTRLSRPPVSGTQMLHIRPSRRLTQCPTGGTRLSRPPVSGAQMLHIRPSRRLTQCPTKREGRAPARPCVACAPAPRTQPSLKCHKNLKLLLDWGGVRYCRIHALLLMALCGEVDDV